MAMKSFALLAFGLSAMTRADETTSVFFPFADMSIQSVAASVIATSGDVKTMVIGCPAGADTNICFIPVSVTATVGPSTLAVFQENSGITGEFQCDIQGSTSANCVQEFTGAASLIESTSVTSDGDKTTTLTSTTTYAASEISFLPVTITAGPTATPSPSSTSSGGKSGSSSSKSSASGSSTASSNAASNIGGVATNVVPAAAAGILLHMAVAL